MARISHFLGEKDEIFDIFYGSLPVLNHENLWFKFGNKLIVPDFVTIIIYYSIWKKNGNRFGKNF
ncbi:hypothetical protein HanHA300_Chr04g0142631 [Helianthus annuus]|nr:hypothetical protein HanHA300_Chr04g0142631 [Helianthus annuus]KAJ0597545.1 hypothetical protein HanHA89_Chr04g0155801 [Helianthus annuus]KAJ0758190.1 hypothetical protein HanLR1_Chr04g0147501 [Helianthus annuus]